MKVYPVLAIMNWPQRIVFYIVTLSIPVWLFFLGEYLNNMVWHKGRTGEAAPKTSKKSKSKKN